jgi:iron complex transport system substrate-binding protein
MKNTIAFAALLLFFLQACHNVEQSKEAEKKEHVKFSSLFSVDTTLGYTNISIGNAWSKHSHAANLLLIPEKETMPENIPSEYQVLRTPLKRMAVMSGTHIAFLDLLDQLDRVVGVSDFRLIKNPGIKNRISKGKIREIGINNTFKKEQLLAANVDAVLVSPYENQSFKSLTDMGITVIPVPDYLERHPLGRAEWIKFFGFLTGKSTPASQEFRHIAETYLTLAGKLDSLQNAPTIFSGKPYGGIWYQPGGESYMASLFEDAGINYLWNENQQSGGIPLDFETVYAKAANADFWRLVVKSDENYGLEDLLNEDNRYADFSAFQNKQVLVCNVSKVPYYEVAPTEPQVVLADFIYWTHPELNIDHQPVYYQKISDD